MDNEKYGIELDLITDKFNKKIDKVKQEVNSVKKVKNVGFDPDDVSGITISWNNSKKAIAGISDEFKKLTGKKEDLSNAFALSKFNRDIQQAKENVNALNAGMQKMSLNDGFKKYETSPIQETVDNYKTLNEEIQQATSNTQNLNSQGSRLKISFSTNAISRNIDKMTSKIKRFGLSLLGIRTTWSLISRASSAYLSQNQELADKLQGVWVGLGSLLAPVIEFVINIFAKAIGFINAFIKALTGVDLLAKSTAKSVNKTTGAVKSLNKALAGFDELQNLDTDAGGGGTGVGNLGDIGDLAEQIELGNNAFKNFKKWLVGDDPVETVKKSIKNAIDMNVQILRLSKKTFEKTLKFVWEQMTKAVPWLEPLIDKIGNKLKETIETTEQVWKPMWNRMIDYLKPNVLDPLYELFSPIGTKIYNAIVPYVNMFIRKINETFGFLGIHLNEWETKSEDVSKNTSVKFSNAMDAIKYSSNLMKASVTGDLALIEKKENDLSKNTINIKANSDSLKKIDTSILTITSSLEKLTGRSWTMYATIEAKAGQTVNTALQGLRTAFSAIGLNLPYLDVGTNYVPQDQLAMIHKGEAVIPKKFNSQEYFGGNDETNSKLDALIDAVNNIEINPYTTIRDVGKASLSYINNKSRQLGESVVV